MESGVELVENTYTEALYSFKVELAWDQFTQGMGIRDDLRGKVFMSQPDSLVPTAVVSRLEIANKACQAVASVEKKKSVNVVSASFCI